MKYFLHDTNASQDEKIMELQDKFGYEGKGLFFTILERIAYQESPIKTAVLKKHLGVGKRLEKCWQFMEDIGLISSLNGETFNKNLMNYSKKYQIQKEKNRERVAKHRAVQAENSGFDENVTHYVTITQQDCNAPKVKVNESKSKEYIEASPTLSLFNDDLTKQDAKNSEAKNHLTKAPVKRFTPPTQEELEAYLTELKIPHVKANAEKFIYSYGQKDWMIGKNKMKNWKLAVSNWKTNGWFNAVPQSQGASLSSTYHPNGQIAPGSKLVFNTRRDNDCKEDLLASRVSPGFKVNFDDTTKQFCKTG